MIHERLYPSVMARGTNPLRNPEKRTSGLDSATNIANCHVVSFTVATTQQTYHSFGGGLRRIFVCIDRVTPQGSFHGPSRSVPIHESATRGPFPRRNTLECGARVRQNLRAVGREAFSARYLLRAAAARFAGPHDHRHYQESDRSDLERVLVGRHFQSARSHRADHISTVPVGWTICIRSRRTKPRG